MKGMLDIILMYDNCVIKKAYSKQSRCCVPWSADATPSSTTRQLTCQHHNYQQHCYRLSVHHYKLLGPFAKIGSTERREG
jgi:hypothetical protein